MRTTGPKTIQQHVWAESESVQTANLERATPESAEAAVAATETDLQLYQCTTPCI
jgi:hypothetical protein